MPAEPCTPGALTHPAPAPIVARQSQGGTGWRAEWSLLALAAVSAAPPALVMAETSTQASEQKHEERHHELACTAATVGGAVLGAAVGSLFGGGLGKSLFEAGGAGLGIADGRHLKC